MTSRAVAVAVVMAMATVATAIANSTSHQDAAGDVQAGCTVKPDPCPPLEDLSESDVDILRATAGHRRGGVLKHTVEVAGEFKDGAHADFGSDPNLFLHISTDAASDVDYSVNYSPTDEKFGVYKSSRRVGPAAFKFNGGKATITFRARAIHGPRNYGWFFATRHDESFGSGEFGYRSDRIPTSDSLTYFEHGVG